jgi:serine protease AprX
MKNKNFKSNVIAALTLVVVIMGCSKESLTKGYLLDYPTSIGLMMNNDFDDLKLSGKGIKVGIIDQGFMNFNSESQTKGIKIVATKNFITNNETNFFTEGPAHGTLVARNMGGQNGKETWGLAFASDYYLAITEDQATETKDEERRMVQAIDWMVKQGVRVINISLGYKEFDNKADNYINDDLYKAKTISGKYIDSLLRANPQVNILVAIGNNGLKSDKTLNTPADVEYVITVGSCDSKGSKRVVSSAVGISTAPFIKPNVMTYPMVAGTSFAAPTIAGLVTVMLEKKPTLTNKEIREILHKSGSNANNPDYEMGYGVPKTELIIPFFK